LYHFDLPYALEEQGGWSNRETIEAFVEYAKVLFNSYGDRVNYWLTINEQKTSPIIGATKISHLEDAVGALEVRLSPEEVSYLEEPYVPHPIVGHN
jgi:beta-glucosidase/6-phospho-beta-glucosidase/beta-galactosidase